MMEPWHFVEAMAMGDGWSRGRSFHRSYVRQHWKEPRSPSDDGVMAFFEAMAMGDGESCGRQRMMESWHFVEAMAMEGETAVAD